MLQEILAELTTEQIIQVVFWIAFAGGLVAGIAASAWCVYARRRWPSGSDRRKKP